MAHVSAGSSAGGCKWAAEAVPRGSAAGGGVKDTGENSAGEDSSAGE